MALIGTKRGWVRLCASKAPGLGLSLIECLRFEANAAAERAKSGRGISGSSGAGHSVSFFNNTSTSFSGPTAEDETATDWESLVTLAERLSPTNATDDLLLAAMLADDELIAVTEHRSDFSTICRY